MHEQIQLAQLLMQERGNTAQNPENRHRRELISRRRAGRRKKRS